MEGSRRYKLPSLDVFTTVRGIGLQDSDFDGLEPVEPSAAAGKLTMELSLRGAMVSSVM